MSMVIFGNTYNDQAGLDAQEKESVRRHGYFVLKDIFRMIVKTPRLYFIWIDGAYIS